MLRVLKVAGTRCNSEAFETQCYRSTKVPLYTEHYDCREMNEYLDQKRALLARMKSHKLTEICYIGHKSQLGMVTGVFPAVFLLFQSSARNFPFPLPFPLPVIVSSHFRFCEVANV